MSTPNSKVDFFFEQAGQWRAEFEQSLSCNQHRLPAGPFSVFLEVEMPHGPEAIKVEQSGHRHEVPDAALGVGVLGVLVGLDGITVGHHAGEVAGVVPEVEFMEYEAGRHA